MNTKILQKILEELNKEVPSIDYLKGMVETLIELSNTSYEYETTLSAVRGGVGGILEKIPANETVEDIPAYLRAGPVGGIN